MLVLELLQTIENFRQRLNKAGQPYGWHIAVITLPETKLGYGATAEAYHEAPQVSLERMSTHIRRFFPKTTAA